MNDLERMLADSAARLFGNEVTPARIASLENGDWPATLWEHVEQSGLTRIFAGEMDGGAQASWVEGLPVLLAAAPAPIPFIDTAACRWLLNGLGLGLPPGPVALADLARQVQAHHCDDGWRLDERVDVPWGRHAAHVLVRAVDDTDQRAPLWLLASTQGGEIEAGTNLAGEPRDRIMLGPVARQATVTGDPACLGASASAPAALGALLRAIAMAGILRRVLNQTVQYASERIQFGKPIGRFQAIQQQLAVLANETAAATMAVSTASAALDTSDADDWVQAAMVAKVLCGQAAGRAAAIAHQVHGAIGFTHEHSLHQSTRRLWSWRMEYGSEADWAGELGRRAIRRGGAALWTDLTASTRHAAA